MFRTTTLNKINNNGVKLLLVSTMALAAQANLPDEIDYQTYLNAYTTVKAQSEATQLKVKELTTSIEAMKLKLENGQISLKAIKSELNTTTSLVARLKEEKQNLERAITNIKDENSSNNSELKAINLEIKTIAVSLKNAHANQVKLEASEKKLRAALSNLEESIASGNSQLAKIQSQLDQETKELAKLRPSLKSASAQNSKLKLEIPKIENELKTSAAQLMKAQKELAKTTSVVDILIKELDLASDAVITAQAEFDEVQIVVSELEKGVKPLVWKRKKILSNIESSEVEVSQAQDALTKAKTDYDSAKVKVSPLKAQKFELTKLKLNLVRKMASVKKELGVVLDRINDLTEDSTKELLELQKKRDSLIEEIANIENLEAANDLKLEEVVWELEEAQKVISQSNTKISSLTRNLLLAESTVKGHKQKLLLVDNQISQRSPKLLAQVKKLEIAKDVLNAAKQKHTVASSKVDAKTVVLNELNVSVDSHIAHGKKLTKLKNETLTKLKASNTQVIELTSAIKKLEASVNKNTQLVGSLKTKQGKLEADRLATQTKITDTEGMINKVAQDQIVLNQKSERADLKKTLITKKLVSNGKRLEVLNTKHLANKNMLAMKNLELSTIDKNLKNVERENKAIAQQKEALELKLSEAKSLSSDLEVETKEQHASYESRKKLYEQYEGEAKELGINKAKVTANSMGTFSGDGQVGEDAGKYGDLHGMNIGKLNSYLKGYVQGAEEGQRIGHDDGMDSSRNYEDGYDKGLAQGRKKAQISHNTVPYQDGYEWVKKDMMANIPSQTASMPNSIEGELFQLKAQGFVRTAPMFISEYEAVEVNEPSEVSYGKQVDAEIARLKKEIAGIGEDKERIRALPQYAYTAVTSVDTKDVIKECLGVYKQVSELVKACEKEFLGVYKTEFSAAHKKAYFEVYEKYFQEARDIAAAKEYEDEHERGVKTGYSTAYTEATVEGEKAAYKKGLSEGEQVGYDEYISEHQDELYAKGTQDAKLLFAKSSVVRLNPDVEVIAQTQGREGLIQNGEFSLGMGLINFGKMASERGAISAKVISASNNVTISDEPTNLRSLPAETQVNLTDVIRAKVTNNAIPGSEVEMKIELTYPGDALKDSYKEVTTFRSEVLVNPSVMSALNYKKEVDDQKCVIPVIRCKYLEHGIKIQLKGERSNIPGAYSIKLGVVEGGKYVEVKTPELMIKSPSLGEIVQGQLSYKFKKRAKGKKIKLKVDISYDSEIVESKEIEISAK